MKRDIDQLKAEETASGSPPAKKHHKSADPDGDTTSNRNKDVFPFFELARELRDLIYDEMLERKRTKIDAGVNLDAFTVKFQPRHTQICRQFHQEAMERAQGVRELELADGPGYGFEEPDLTLQDSHIRALHICLTANEVELVRHSLWVDSLLGSPSNVTETRIKINAISESGPGILKILSTSTFWSSIDSLRELAVYEEHSSADEELYDDDECDDDPDFDFSGRYHTPVGRWNAESGAFEKVEA
ncbi:hypothetical protein Slin15195_G086100 [Septoria linicola]|uniref:Uncharacterized protein n=1 Tax=Septoria linicola TaxID=215465 RepID=A0A9Q9EKZ0_9PEZI|nr:hypothetical protein Slin14017_G088690 [Septoria linicola]USW55291.1 hypothetical protein Slin15195_G086100 [Septoria linicola]